MPLTSFRCINAKVSDLSPLKDVPLKEISLGRLFQPERDAAILRSIKTLEKINGKPAAAFWKEVASAPPIEEAWFKQVAAMPPEKQVEAVAAKLKERNPDFDGKVTPKIQDGVVTEVAFGLGHVTDVSPLRALAGLQFFNCLGSAGKSQFADLSPLAGLKLRWVAFAYTQVSDLTPLKDMKLEFLNCGNTQVSDLSPLKGMPLVVLSCHDTKISDLSPLAGMPLSNLNCRNTPVVDLSPLQNLPLKELTCTFQPERDAAILRSIKTLQRINGQSAAEFWKGVNARATD